MKNSFWKSKNFWANMLRLVLLAFTIGGAAVNPDDAFKIVDSLSSGHVFSLITLLGVSVISPIISFVKNATDAKKLLFLKSTNFWNDVLNFILGLFLTTQSSIIIPENTAPDLINYINQGAWATVITLILSNIIIPFIHIFVKKEPEVMSAKYL